MGDSADRPHGINLSRRQMLKGVGLAGAAVATPAAAAPAPPPRPREALETLTAAEAETLEAACARLIPSDADGPGAREARAAHYIDRALGGALSASRETYRVGLSALDAQARAARGVAFAALAPADQDALLRETEAGRLAGYPASAAFFALLRAHTIQGTFCDPYYGGNAGFVGWDMLGYPGVRMAVAPAQQAMNAKDAPTHASAYDFDMFAKVTPGGQTLAQAGGHRHDD